ncbi:MAG: 2-oxo acid dehydrogenase subunit E2 [Planctomycetaceae bacterium]
MHWPVSSPPLADSETPLWQFYYQVACPPPSDPTMVWGSDVPMQGVEQYVRAANADSPVLISPAHVLLRAVALAMRKHPRFNRRLIAGRAYQYREVNVQLSLFSTRQNEVEVLLLERADERPLVEIARELWRYSQQAARAQLPHFGRATIYDLLPRFFVRRLLPLHLWLFNRFNWPVTSFWQREHRSAVLVNYLAFKGAPPMRAYKPSRFPTDATPFSVTLGPAEPRAVVAGNQVRVESVAPLFVRGDHRLVDAHDLGLFTGTIREYLADPAAMDRDANAPQPLAA